MAVSHHTNDDLRTIIESVSTIVVLGASATAGKPSHNIPQYLSTVGYTIVPINPHGGQLHGFDVYTSLDDAAKDHSPIELLNVWRPPSESVDIAQKAIELGVKRLWFQLDLDTPAATELATAAGIDVITGTCIGQFHRSLRLDPRTQQSG